MYKYLFIAFQYVKVLFSPYLLSRMLTANIFVLKGNYLEINERIYVFLENCRVRGNSLLYICKGVQVRKGLKN